MARYISSICVTLHPKDSSLDLRSFVICLDPNSGSTLPHAINFAMKNPLVKSYFSKYFVSGLTFKYSTL
uniref:Uncharacterized protein n=1 Tax=Dulem virus 244 TaxID=3145721 RepID=A0AAU8BAD3_9VIRU